MSNKLATTEIINLESYEQYILSSVRRDVYRKFGIAAGTRLDQIVMAIFSGQERHAPLLILQLLELINSQNES